MNIDDDVDMDGGDDTNKSSLVRYLHIAEVPDEYTIGIFVFGPGERIPLHDHPEMCVLSRVLYGDLERLSLDLDRRGRSPNDDNFCLSRSSSSMNSSMDTDDEDDDDEEDNMNEASNSSIGKFLSSSAPPGTNSNNNSSTSSPIFNLLSRSANWLHHNLYNNSISSEGFQLDDDVDALHYARHKRRNQMQQQQQPRTTPHYPEGTKLAYRNAMDVLEAPNVASLYPYEGNLHEFVAGPHGAAVLDVLLPPYDDERKRDCTFYHIRDVEGTTTSSVTAGRRSVPAHEALDSSMSLPLSPPGGPTKLKPTDKTQQQQQQRQPCYIVPTGQPENFHCISGRYKDLGDTDDYSEYEYDEE